MSGHSKWSNIKRSKGLQDAKRGNLFTRLSKDISIAVKLGGGKDINSNSMLKVAVSKAKLANMPNDRIQKAIDRGLGITKQGDLQYEKIYEAYTPHQVPVLIEVLTDNPNRTHSDIKIALTKNGGKLVNEGSISWQFKEVGLIKTKRKVDNQKEKIKTLEELELALFEIDGIENVKTYSELEGDLIEVIIETKKEALKRVYDEIVTKMDDLEVESANLAKIYIGPEIDFSRDAKSFEEFQKWIDNLQDIAEVENVWIGLNLNK
jgi:YebC/PmpR family DNA-binding regulatory protein